MRPLAADPGMSSEVYQEIDCPLCGSMRTDYCTADGSILNKGAWCPPEDGDGVIYYD